MRVNCAALDVEHVSGGQDDRERLDPLARRAVFERGRAGGVRRDYAADRRTGEGGSRRVVSAGSSEDRFEREEADARLHAHAVGVRRSSTRLSRVVLSTMSPIGVAPPVSDDCAPMGSTAEALPQHGRDLRLAVLEPRDPPA